MSREAISFKERVYMIVQSIPTARVMTYGDIATVAGQPRAARIVGQLAHYGDPKLPWHRVVNRFGGLASGYYGGRDGQKLVLEAEGIAVDDTFTLKDFERLRWLP